MIKLDFDYANSGMLHHYVTKSKRNIITQSMQWNKIN